MGDLSSALEITRGDRGQLGHWGNWPVLLISPDAWDRRPDWAGAACLCFWGHQVRWRSDLEGGPGLCFRSNHVGLRPTCAWPLLKSSPGETRLFLKVPKCEIFDLFDSMIFTSWSVYRSVPSNRVISLPFFAQNFFFTTFCKGTPYFFLIGNS